MQKGVLTRLQWLWERNQVWKSVTEERCRKGSSSHDMKDADFRVFVTFV